MKYRNLLEMLQNFSEEELDNDVTILSNGIGEFYPVVTAMFYADDSDVLDQGHPYLILDDGTY